MRRRVIRVRRRSTRSVQWGNATIAPINVTAGSLIQLPITPGALSTMSALGTPTLMRIRGTLRIVQTTTTSGTESYGASGIITASRAITIPATGIDPYGTGASLNWLWHKFYWTTNTSGSAVEVRSMDFEVDAKAMRKIEDTEDIYFVFSNAITSSATVRIFFSARILVKTP